MSGSVSFNKYPSAPASIKVKMSFLASDTVKMTIRASTSSALNALSVSKPESPFIFRSKIMRSGEVCSAKLIPSEPLPAPPTTSKPSSNSTSCCMPRRINGWSSIIKTFNLSFMLHLKTKPNGYGKEQSLFLLLSLIIGRIVDN